MSTEALGEYATDNYTYYDFNTTESPLCALNSYCETMDDYFDRLNAYIYPEPFEWGLIVLYIITFLVGLVGNSLVCFAVWRNTKMRTITNMFIVNLSVADLGVIIICLPSTLLVDVTETWFLGTTFCKTHLFLMVSTYMSYMLCHTCYKSFCQHISFQRRLMTKQTKWHVRSANTRISLGIRPV